MLACRFEYGDFALKRLWSHGTASRSRHGCRLLVQAEAAVMSTNTCFLSCDKLLTDEVRDQQDERGKTFSSGRIRHFPRDVVETKWDSGRGDVELIFDKFANVSINEWLCKPVVMHVAKTGMFACCAQTLLQKSKALYYLKSVPVSIILMLNS